MAIAALKHVSPMSHALVACDSNLKTDTEDLKWTKTVKQAL